MKTLTRLRIFYMKLEEYVTLVETVRVVIETYAEEVSHRVKEICDNNGVYLKYCDSDSYQVRIKGIDSGEDLEDDEVWGFYNTLNFLSPSDFIQGTGIDDFKKI